MKKVLYQGVKTNTEAGLQYEVLDANMPLEAFFPLKGAKMPLLRKLLILICLVFLNNILPDMFPTSSLIFNNNFHLRIQPFTTSVNKNL